MEGEIKTDSSISTFKKPVFWVLAVLTVFIFFVAGYVYKFNIPFVATDSLSEVELGGILLFTAVNLDEEPPSFKTISLDFTQAEPSLNNDADYVGTPSSSFVKFKNPNDPEDFFVRVPYYEPENGDTEADVVNSLFHVDPPDNISLVSNDRKQEVGAVSWSETANSLAYSTLSAEVSGVSTVSDWDVVISDIEGNELDRIAGAANPVWVPQQRGLLYVSQDGIAYYDLDTKTSEVLIGLEYIKREDAPVGLATMVDVSPDGNYMILTTQDNGLIEVYEVDWEEMDLVLMNSAFDIDRIFSWPVISPDGKSYAVLALSKVDGKLLNPQIEIRNLLGASEVFSYPLESFDPRGIFLDDWISRSILPE